MVNNLFGPSGGFGSIGGSAGNNLAPQLPKPQEQQFGGGMMVKQPPANFKPYDEAVDGPRMTLPYNPPMGPPTGPGLQLGSGMKPMSGAGGLQPSAPGNSLFGHSQGLGGGQINNSLMGPMQKGIQSPQLPPDVMQQLMQLFGSSQGMGKQTVLGMRPDIAQGMRF